MPVQKGADARQAPSSATAPAMAPGLLSPAEATKVLSKMTFDNLPLRESLFASLFESKADTEKRLEDKQQEKDKLLETSKAQLAAIEAQVASAPSTLAPSTLHSQP